MQYEQVIRAFVTQYPGIAINGIYCQMTGARIGTINEYDRLGNDQYIEWIESLPGDAEEVADDIALRIFASMRPGYRWNKMRVETLDTLRHSHPVDTCAYLLNRLINSPNYRGDTLAINHDRIKLYNWLSHTAQKAFVETLIRNLIHIDARLSLNKLESPATVHDIIERLPLLKLTLIFEDWNDRQMAAIERVVVERQLETRYFRDGNTLAKHASSTMFWESQPKSESQVKKTEKKQDSAFMQNVLNAMLNAPVNEIQSLATESVSKIHIPSGLAAKAMPSQAIRRVVSFGRKPVTQES